MKNYEDLEKELKEQLEDIASEDEYGLKPETLYRNICNSTGSDESLAEIFAVPVGVVRAVKKS